jgi:putative membrane protein
LISKPYGTNGENMIKHNIFAAAAIALSVSIAGQIVSAKEVAQEEQKRVSHIAQDGMAECKLGKLAESKAKHADVKAFAKHMVTDHGKANDELKSAAKEAGVKLPDDCSAEQKSAYEALDKLSGEAFDRKYMDEMVKGHEKAVDAIGKESSDGTGSLKAWADKTLPTIKEHKKEADDLNTKVSAK